MWIFLALIACYVLYRVIYQDESKKPPNQSSYKTTQKVHSTPLEPYANKQLAPKKVAATLPNSQNFQTFIAGIPHRLGKDVQISSILSSGQKLTYSREPTNKYDQNAIKLIVNTKHLGYVPKEDNPTIAKHLDAGGTMTVSVMSIDKSDIWRGVKIGITLH